MSDHDAGDYLLENSRLNLRRALAMVEQLRKDNEQLRAALAARPQREEALAIVVEIAFDWAGEYGFGSPAAARRVWEAARLLRPDLEPKAPEAPAGSAASTGDDDG